MERLMVIMAHPDDESFACGGTIAQYSGRGVPVTYMCATRGEMGRRMGVPPFASRESLGALRERELREACRALGIADLRLLGIWDKTVEFVEPEALAEQVRAIVREVRPTLLITFHPEHGRHPDHNAIGAAAIRAVAGLPPAERPVVYAQQHRMAKIQLPLKTIEIDITATLDAKRAAIAAHRSQSEGMMEQFEARYKDDPAGLAKFRESQKQERFWVWEF